MHLLLNVTLRNILWKKLIIGILTTFSVFLFYYQFKDRLIDDAFITFRYALTLQKHFTWGFYPEWSSNTATSPLNVVLLALSNYIFSDMVITSIAVTTLEVVLSFILFVQISKTYFKSMTFAWLASMGLLLNPLLLSTIGLESYLFFLLLVFSIYLLFPLRPLLLGMAIGLLTLARPDGFLIFLSFLLYLIIYQPADGKINVVLIFSLSYIITIMPWYLYSWINLGSILPDTFFIKLHQQWGGSLVTGIIIYSRKYPLEFLLSFIYFPVSLIRFSRIPFHWKYLVVFMTMAHFIAYVILQIPPYHWYYTLLVFATIFLGSFGLTSKNKFNNEVHIKSLGMLIIGLFVVIMVFRNFVFQEMPLISSNWASQNQYKTIAKWLSDSVSTTKPIKLEGEVGTIGYFCTHRIDNYFTTGINDSIITNRFYRKSFFTKYLAIINHAFWKPQCPKLSPSWGISIKSNYRDTTNIYRQRSSWILSSRFNTMGIGVARLYKID
jgi:hypothetical protein